MKSTSIARVVKVTAAACLLTTLSVAASQAQSLIGDGGISPSDVPSGPYYQTVSPSWQGQPYAIPEHGGSWNHRR